MYIYLWGAVFRDGYNLLQFFIECVPQESGMSYFFIEHLNYCQNFIQ